MKKLLPTFVLLFIASAPLAAEDLYREDSFMGDYRGSFLNPTRSYVFSVLEWYAQVYPLGHGKYHLRFVPTLYERVPHLFEAEATLKGDALHFDIGHVKGEIREGVFSGQYQQGEDWVDFKLEHFVRHSPTEGLEPIEGAVVLWDGDDFDAWQPWEDGTPKFDVVDGALQIRPGKGPKRGNLFTSGRYGDIYLHIEFRTTYEPTKRGQQRGNSGIYFQHSDEIQVLDSYGLIGWWNEAGGIYRVASPKINMAYPPTHWQTYDAVYTAPRFNENGSVASHGSFTVYHNGFRIHHNQVVPAEGTEARRNLTPGPIMLQDHSHPIQYRNIWLVEIESDEDRQRIHDFLETLDLVEIVPGKFR